jgi:hypothetical protein
MRDPSENLKVIWFEGEMLPPWAQLLDAAARLCPVSEDTRSWFSRFTNASGVDDARTIVAEAEILQSALRARRETIITELQRTRGDGQATRIFAAWHYALDTMIQAAAARQTCSWNVESAEDTGAGGYGGDDITLRRV